jgi:hypothetical protein
VVDAYVGVSDATYRPGWNIARARRIGHLLGVAVFSRCAVVEPRSQISGAGHGSIRRQQSLQTEQRRDRASFRAAARAGVATGQACGCGCVCSQPRQAPAWYQGETVETDDAQRECNAAGRRRRRLRWCWCWCWSCARSAVAMRRAMPVEWRSSAAPQRSKQQ